MPNIRLSIAYDGSRYAGWQIQKNRKTIQWELERALRKILKSSVKINAAGRTDAGVHARAQVVNFRTDKHFPLKRLQAALNANLPKDISVVTIKNALLRFHSRFDANSKIYRYAILNSRIDNPFLRRFYYRIPYALDISLMRREAKVLVGRHNFKSFQAKSAFSSVRSAVRTIKRITIKKEGRYIYIDIEADGFLHHMVRNIVGTLVDIGRGYLAEGSMRKILRSRDRKKAGPTVPARGLTLVKVKY